MKKLRFGIKNRTNPKGETRVYIIYSFNRDQRTEIGTDIYIQPELWNKEKQEVNKKHPSAAQFNNHLLLQKVELEAIYLKLTAQGKTPFPEIIRDLHDKKGGQNIDETNFFDNLDQWIERRKNQVSLDSWKDYKSLKKHLLGFHSFRKKKIRFESIDYSLPIWAAWWIARRWQPSQNGLGHIHTVHIHAYTCGRPIRHVLSST